MEDEFVKNINKRGIERDFDTNIQKCFLNDTTQDKRLKKGCVCLMIQVNPCLSGLEIEHNGITIVLDHKGRNSGEAFVQFSSKTAADEALKRDRQLIGNR